MKQRLFNITLTIIGMAFVSGCSSLQDQLDETRFVNHAKRSAQLAWLDSLACYQNLEHNLDEFERGFIEGYIAVATGGNGCPPTLPPRRYWKTKYSTPLGKKLIVAWFDGYHHGAAAAMADGTGNSRRILTSGEIYNKCREYVEYMPEDEQFDSYQEHPEIIAPLPLPTEKPPAFPGIDNTKVPLTPPAKPYVPKEEK